MTTEAVEKDRVSEIAEQKMAQLEADEKVQADQKTEDESKGASADKSSTETEKTKGSENNEQEETKQGDEDKVSKTDVEILATEDDDLNEEETTRKQELMQQQEDAKTPEQKLTEWQEKTNKRFDELSGELKAAKDGRTTDAETIKMLEDRIAQMKVALENSGSIKSDAVVDAETAKESYVRMVDEDKDLDRGERREMSKEELEEYLLEDYTEASEWLVQRGFRRKSEQDARVMEKKSAVDQSDSVKSFFTEFPECNQEVRQTELIAEGKSVKEALDVIRAENKDFALMMDLMHEDPKYRDKVTGPGLLAAEMRERKSVKSTDKETYTKEEVEQMKKDAIDAEQKRIASIDQGLTDSSVTPTAGANTPEYKEGLRVFQMAGKRKGQTWTEQDYKEILLYGKTARKE